MSFLHFTVSLSFVLSCLVFTVQSNPLAQYYRNNSYCYGDSSSQRSNLVNESCADVQGYFYVHDVLIATKPTSLNCPQFDHISNPANYDTCCKYNAATDCNRVYTGDVTNFLNCNGKTVCRDIPAVQDRIETACTRQGSYMEFSNFMIFEYYCVPPGYNFGPCNSTADCTDQSALCNKSMCVCQDGYTSFDAFDSCWEDGKLNGSCDFTHDCTVDYTECLFAPAPNIIHVDVGRCHCETGYSPLNGECREDGGNGGQCVGTGTCQHAGTTCDVSSGRCVCAQGFVSRGEFCYEDCSTSGTCSSANTVCDPVNGTCNCVSGSSMYKGHCIRDGELHGNCLPTTQACTDSNTQCDNARGKCVCAALHSEYQGFCAKDGEIGGRCNVTLPCTIANTTCDASSGRCLCTTGYVVYEGQCIPDGQLHGYCSNPTVPCTGANTTCDSASSRCVCKTSHSDYNGVCYKDGGLYGSCSSSQPCTDPNTVCLDGRCQCSSGFSEQNGICYQDGSLHGNCLLVSGRNTCLDPNTLCVSGKCVCATGYSAYQDRCIKDGDLNGGCTTNTDCVTTNAYCDTGSGPGKCTCETGFSEHQGTCVQDGMLNGHCSDPAIPCMDSFTTCNATSGRCVCKVDYSQYNGVCYKDQHLYGECKGFPSNDCLDTHTVCNTTSGRCECESGTSEYQGQCFPDGSLFGNCMSGNPSCLDSLTECDPVTGRCFCISGYSSFNGTCYKDGDLNGGCNTNSDCVTDNANCDAGTGRCSCDTSYSEYDGKCVKDGTLNGQCSNPSTPCTDSFTICNPATGRCVCEAGYSEYEGVCYQDQTLHGQCTVVPSDDCTDARTTCNATTGRCECEDGTSEYREKCIPDGELHGYCEKDTECVGHDQFVICFDYRCECMTGYHDINGVCVEDGELGGYCEVKVDCHDQNAICTNKICVCKSGYSIIDDECVRDGDTGGVCLSVPNMDPCNDGNAMCDVSSNKCKCKSNFTLINGVCEEDRRLYGRCTNQSACLDALNNCSDIGICVCIHGYAAVNDTCIQNGSIGGVCNPDGSCQSAHAQCTSDVDMICKNQACQPGICRCDTNAILGDNGICILDGNPGGRCQQTSDCVANAFCDSTARCVCSNGFTAVGPQCVADGEPSGRCSSTPGAECNDAHSICVNGTCICNDQRNYVLIAGQCVKDDGYVLGRCNNGCLDPNSECVVDTCVCKSDYSTVNGECVPASCCGGAYNGTSGVTSCNGTSPYNTLAAECGSGTEPIILDVYTMVKPGTINCSTELNVYTATEHERCCTPRSSDCRLDGLGTHGCSSTDLIGSFSTYNVLEYICVPMNTVIAPGNNDQGSGNPAYVVGTNATGDAADACAVKASCQTTLAVYITFLKPDQMCPDVVFTEGSVTQSLPCDTQRITRNELVVTFTSGYFTINNNKLSGKYVLKIEAADAQATVDVRCGIHAASLQPSVLPACGPSAGQLGDHCNATLVCAAANSACVDGICHCVGGFEEKEGHCTATGEDDSGSSALTTLLAILIPVACVVGLLIAGYLLKDKIRKKCRPEEEKSDLGAGAMVVGSGPSPANTKFPGRPSEKGDFEKPLPPLPRIGSATPMNRRFNGRLPTDLSGKTLRPRTLPPVGTVTPLPSQPPGQRDMTPMKYIEREEMKNLQKGHGNGAVPSTTNEHTPKKKKHRKKMRKTKIGIDAVGAFQSGMQQGSYTPNENFGPSHATNGAVSNGHLPPLPRGSHHLPPMTGSSTPFSAPSPGPTNAWNSYRDQMGAPPLPIPQAAGPPGGGQGQRSFVRRSSILEIANVNDPTHPETTNMD